MIFRNIRLKLNNKVVNYEYFNFFTIINILKNITIKNYFIVIVIMESKLKRTQTLSLSSSSDSEDIDEIETCWEWLSSDRFDPNEVWKVFDNKTQQLFNTEAIRNNSPTVKKFNCNL
jgi:hypothetical protein